ncbi:MAG TPA: response regulator transcription factor [Azospirillaceae bacterium]|nr:response regulator transcription factor [Azospirillaceae bacterium]
MIQAPDKPRPRVLVVEDDAPVGELLRVCLEAEGMEVVSAATLADAREAASRQPFEVFLVDLVLEDGSGLDLVRTVRERTRAGIMIVSGRSAPVDRIVGLEVGADDYVTKPFEPREVSVRVRRLCERVMAARTAPAAPAPAAPATATAEPAGPPRYGFRGWLFDPPGQTVARPDGTLVELTAAESRLLEVFVLRPNRTLSRDQLLDAIHGRGWNPSDRSIDVLVGKLRAKLSAGAAEDPIRTVRGAGYLFAPVPERV